MGNKLTKPSPVPIIKDDALYNLKSNTIDRVVKFVSNLLENIKEFSLLANGKKKKQGASAQLAGTVGDRAAKALSKAECPYTTAASVLIFPAVALYQNMSEIKTQIEAIKKIWHINDSPTNQAKFLEDVILAATKIFLSFEIPCNLFGSQYMDLVAQDAVHRIFNYLGSKYKDKYDPDWILKGVILGKSTREGRLAKFRLAPAGFQLDKYNTARIFTSPGLVSRKNPETIFKCPKQEVYGYRLLLAHEPEPPMTQTKPKDQSKLPTIIDWDDASTEELTKEICAEVKGKIKGIVQKLKLYFEEVREQLDSISGKCDKIQDSVDHVNRAVASLVNQPGSIQNHGNTLEDREALLISLETHINRQFDIQPIIGRESELEKLHELREEIGDWSIEIGDRIIDIQSSLANVECLLKQPAADPNQILVNTSSESIWFGVEYPVESFTGRQEQLSSLHGLLTRSTGIPTVKNQISIVSGLGGIGKSQLAKKYLQIYNAHYERNAIWIDAETQESFTNSLVKLLEMHFNISEENSRKKSNAELLEIIYDWCSTRKCLIIMDNVEDFAVRELLPNSRRPDSQIPTVLITSRNPRWPNGVKVLNLDVLSIGEAVKFVHENTGTKETEDHVLHIAQTLYCLPLALQQAVAYINERYENDNSIPKYLCQFESPKIEGLLNYKEDLSGHEKNIFKTLAVTMKSIQTKKCGLLAIRIMDIISCFEPDNIPACIFQSLKLNSVESTKDPASDVDNRPKTRKSRNNGRSVWGQVLHGVNVDMKPQLTSSASLTETPSQDEVEAAVALLRKYSMVSGRPGLVNVHRLVQQMVRIKIEKQIKPVLREALELLHKFMDGSFESDDYLVKSLLPHAQSVWRHTLNHEDLVREYPSFQMDLCAKLSLYGRNSSKIQIAKEFRSEIMGNKKALMKQLKEAVALHCLGDFTGSLEILKKIQPISEGERRQENTHARHMSMLVAMNLERLEAVEMSTKVLATILDSNEFESGSECASLANLGFEARILPARGELDESLGFYQTMHEGLKERFGEEDYQTLWTRIQIAQVLSCKGMWAEAIEHLNIVKETQMQLHRDEDRLTGRTTYLLQICHTVLAN